MVRKAIVVALLLLAPVACSTPSNDGLQTELEAFVPIEGRLKFK